MKGHTCGIYMFGTSSYNKHKPGKGWSCVTNNYLLAKMTFSSHRRGTAKSSLSPGSQSLCPGSNQKVLGEGVKFVPFYNYMSNRQRSKNINAASLQVEKGPLFGRRRCGDLNLLWYSSGDEGVCLRRLLQSIISSGVQIDLLYIYVIYANGILLSHQEKWYVAICNDVDGTRGIMLTEISQRKTNAIRFHSLVEIKKQNRWT